ncbi:MAG: ribose 5-phosphate isomerase B [Candidatus Krumholzibacteriia bacterium]
MKIAIGADHRGYVHKATLSAWLAAAGHEVVDMGGQPPDLTDYPQPALAVGEAVAAGRCARGVLVCGTGIGVCMAANKVAGVRAARCCSVDEARISRRHNNANVLCLSGDGTTPEQAVAMLQAWLETAFEGGRHARRLDLITSYEAGRGEGGGSPSQPRPRPQEEGQS